MRPIEIFLLILGIICFVALCVLFVKNNNENYSVLKNIGLHFEADITDQPENSDEERDPILKYIYGKPGYTQYKIRKAKGQLEFGNIL